MVECPSEASSAVAASTVDVASVFALSPASALVNTASHYSYEDSAQTKKLCLIIIKLILTEILLVLPSVFDPYFSNFDDLTTIRIPESKNLRLTKFNMR